MVCFICHALSPGPGGGRMVGWGVLWGTVTPHASCLAILLSRDHQVIRAIGKQTHWDLFTQMSFMTIKTALVRSHSKKKVTPSRQSVFIPNVSIYISLPIFPQHGKAPSESGCFPKKVKTNSKMSTAVDFQTDVPRLRSCAFGELFVIGAKLIYKHTLRLGACVSQGN